MYVVRSWSSRHARTSLDYLCIPNHRTLQCASPPLSPLSSLVSPSRSHPHLHSLSHHDAPPLCDEVFALLGLIACCTYGLLDDVTWRDETWWGCCLLLMMMRLSLSVCLLVKILLIVFYFFPSPLLLLRLTLPDVPLSLSWLRTLSNKSFVCVSVGWSLRRDVHIRSIRSPLSYLVQSVSLVYSIAFTRMHAIALLSTT